MRLNHKHACSNLEENASKKMNDGPQLCLKFCFLLWLSRGLKLTAYSIEWIMFLRLFATKDKPCLMKIINESFDIICIIYSDKINESTWSELLKEAYQSERNRIDFVHTNGNQMKSILQTAKTNCEGQHNLQATINQVIIAVRKSTSVRLCATKKNSGAQREKHSASNRAKFG